MGNYFINKPMTSVMESSRLGGYVTQYDHVNFSTAK